MSTRLTKCECSRIFVAGRQSAGREKCLEKTIRSAQWLERQGLYRHERLNSPGRSLGPYSEWIKTKQGTIGKGRLR